jgi:hypothetical protein
MGGRAGNQRRSPRSGASRWDGEKEAAGGDHDGTGANVSGRDPLSHRLGGLDRFPLCDPAEAKAVADRHFAGETERLGAGADLLDIEEAHLARLVQMNVEPNAAPRRDREDTVELPLRVAVNLQRIDATDQIGAVANTCASPNASFASVC